MSSLQSLLFRCEGRLSFPRSGVGVPEYRSSGTGTLERPSLHSHAGAWERCRFLHVTLVPKLLLGNSVSKALALRDGKLELPTLNSQAEAWELALTKIINLTAMTQREETGIFLSFPRAAWECLNTAPAVRDAGASLTAFPRRSVGTMSLSAYLRGESKRLL